VSPFRLVLVTQRFWPLMGRAARATANLAAEFASRKIDVTVLTARWHPLWPAKVVCGGVPVVRIAGPAGRGRSMTRYVKALGRWLEQNQDRYELVYVSELKHEAYAALGAARKGVPVVLRAEAAGRFGDCLWQLEARGGRRIKRECMKAAALIAPSRLVERELIAAGYPRHRVHYLPYGVPIPPARSPARRTAAHTALGEANVGLRMPDDAPLAVYTGRLDAAKGLPELVSAWQRVVASRPQARLWLAGEGPLRNGLAEQIAGLGLSGRVVLAGVFDSVEELLAAADLFVLPSREEGPSLALLEAMAAGLPIVATDIPGTRELVTDGQHGLLVPGQDIDALSAAILRLLDAPKLALELGAAARARAQAQFSLAQTADAHLKLFGQAGSGFNY